MIYIVTGLPRSGTSLAMQMIYNGGVPVYTDNQKPADQHNPKGYYEHNNVSNIECDLSWLDNCEGKAVKIIAPKLYYLNLNKQYKIIYMHRNIHSICRSQEEMIKEKDKRPEDIESIKQKWLNFLDIFFKDFWDWDLKIFNYEDILDEPELQSSYIKKFLDISLNTRKMAKAIDQDLWHE